MRNFGVATAASAAIMATSFFVSSVVADVDPIVIKGSKFFYKGNGTQFYMKGVAYQQEYNSNSAGGGGDGETSNGGSGGGSTAGNGGYTDPISDDSNCERDIPYLSELGTNTIRVYAVDPKKSHDRCMGLLADEGIYVIADLSAPVSGQSINRADPAWDDETYARYVGVVDALAKYDNTLGFFAGNEVSNNVSNTDASAFVKAAVRDMKAYIKREDYREIGVGYAANDDEEIRDDISTYFNCGDRESSVDFWGYNIYSWCGDSSFQESGYDQRTKEFSTYSVPSFFAEYGCNEVSPRPFTEVEALYGDKMNDVFSGGIVYMYFQEENDYGLVKVDGDDVSTLKDFNNLKTQLASVSPSGTQMASYSPTNSMADCPSTNSDWHAIASPLPPTPNKQLCACMYASLECVPDSSVKEDDYEDQFDYICGTSDDACAGIAANGSQADYGAYGMCNSTEKLGFVMNAYYNEQGGGASACDFDGAGSTKSSASPTGQCSQLLEQAGADGTKTVSDAPQGTGEGDGGSGGSGGSESGSDGAGAMVGVPGVQSGLFPLAFVVSVGLLSGAGMLLL